MPELKLNYSTDQIDSILEQLRYGKYTAENWDIDILKGINFREIVVPVLLELLEYSALLHNSVLHQGVFIISGLFS